MVDSGVDEDLEAAVVDSGGGDSVDGRRKGEDVEIGISSQQYGRPHDALSAPEMSLSLQEAGGSGGSSFRTSRDKRYLPRSDALLDWPCRELPG